MVEKMPKIANRLINEMSPYLLQHAYNPVYWYPWGEEAFEKAKKENKPIFLSIGYSTCHWCHVMEKESFEDMEVAKLLNTFYVCIKVDREERPDIDEVYMAFCQGMTGAGGWPLTIIMTPNQEPFFAGTYFPKTSRYRRPGMIQLLPHIAKKWEEEHEALLQNAQEIVMALKGHKEPKEMKQSLLSIDEIEKCIREFKSRYEKQYGGFSDAPKFPSPHQLMFLMRYYYEEKESYVLEMVENTLKHMYKGGLFDHIGYGFSRYSTDRMWLVPHFEKMLYDNALLIITYLEAYTLTGNRLYRFIGQSTLEYVLRELHDSEGGFYCGQDADSEGEEGKYYTFNPLEIIDVLGEEDGKAFNDYFGITASGNFEGKNIPNKLHHLELSPPSDELEEWIKKVYAYRIERVKLHKDDKVLTSWNGLMIVALAKGYAVLGEKAYLEKAEGVLALISEKLTTKEGRLLARYREGEAKYLAYLEDYAFLTWGLLTLYEVTLEETYLRQAEHYQSEVDKLFWDEQEGGYFIYGKDAKKLILRPKATYDGAMPSGSAVATMNRIKLSRLTDDHTLLEKAQIQLEQMSSKMISAPTGYSYYLMCALEFTVPGDRLKVRIKEKEELLPLKEWLHKSYHPFLTLQIQFNDKVSKNNETTYNLCNDRGCLPGTNDLEVIKEHLLSK